MCNEDDMNRNQSSVDNDYLIWKVLFMRIGKLVSVLSSYRLTLVLLVIYALLLAVATFVESRFDSAMARMFVYNNAGFYLLQFLMITNFIAVMLKGRLLQRKRYAALIFHIAFVVVLTGAFITRVSGFEGIMHIREGESSDRMITQESYVIYTLKKGDMQERHRVPLSFSVLGGASFCQRHAFQGENVVLEMKGSPYIAESGKRAISLLVRRGTEERSIVLENIPYTSSVPTYLSFGDLVIEITYGADNIKLPFSVKLTDFRLLRYPGSYSPSSFESDLVLTNDKGESREEHLYMNKVVHEKGYRLYQSSYDPDERGTILSVNNDYWGTMITYCGYWLLLIGILWVLIGKNTRFRFLIRRLQEIKMSEKGIFFVVLLFSGVFTVSATPDKVAGNMSSRIPSTRHAEKFGSLLIQSPSGRIEPVNTYTEKLLRKIYRDDQYNGLSSDQVILGMLVNPSYWNHVKIIRQTNKQLQKILGTEEGVKYISFFDVFDQQGNYKIASQVEQIYNKPVKARSSFDKDVLKLDEKINIIYALQQRKMLALFPLTGDANNKWYSPGDDLSAYIGKDSMFVSKIFDWYLSEISEAMVSGQWQEADEVAGMIDTYQRARSNVELMDKQTVAAELLYNKLNIFGVSAKIYLILGISFLLFSVLGYFRRTRVLELLSGIWLGLIVLAFVFHSFGIGMRWYISGQAPWSNAYESMVYVGWASAFAGLLFCRRSRIAVALATFLAGLILFVANLNWMDPEITPLVPVLKSYWLMLHVAVITASYGFFGMSFLLGLTSMVMMNIRNRKNTILWNIRIEELRIINELSLTIGLCLLTAGTFLGAVWANESWGRYWGWDPKETWALITMIVYALVLHARFIPKLRSDFAFSVMSVFALTSVLMTYFGVNYYLSGLHSYGKGDTPPALDIIYIVFALIIALTCWTAWHNRRFSLPETENLSE